MSPGDSFHKWISYRKGLITSKRALTRRRLHARLYVEQLEDRIVPAPTIMLTAPANGFLTNNNLPILSATASANGGSLASVQFQYSSDTGATWQNAGPPETSGPFSYTFTSPLPDGTYTVRAVATDNAGNSAVSNGVIQTLGTFHSPSAGPRGNLVQDGAGNLFGTLAGVGANGDGMVYEIIAGSAIVTPLAYFNGTNGTAPQAGLVLDDHGNLFGTAEIGGASGQGTVFEVAAGSGTITPLASFNGANGANPATSLILDGSGNLFGVTPNGGAFGGGTVFEVAAGSGTITTLASFNYSTTGFSPDNLFEDNNDNLFGTTTGGGAFSYGTVFKVAAGSGIITPLASFNSPTTGLSPNGLVEDSGGNFFGTTAYGGASSDGTVFKLAAGSTTITTVASFSYATTGFSPTGLIKDGSGNLFGTTTYGGAAGFGTIFEVTAGGSTITPLVSFTAANGAPQAGLALDISGNLFGTTASGGTSGYGTAFKLAAGSSAITPLASFSSSNVGADPQAALVEDSHGNLFGTTPKGGSYNAGTVFEVAAGSGVISTLASFNGTNGANPIGSIAEDQSGNLFGTTQLNGGTIFELAAGSGTINSVAVFTDGFNPNGLIGDSHGNFFGTTAYGGSSNNGTVFELVAGSGTITTLASFNGTTGGANPQSGLVLDQSGNLFGTTANSGAFGNGTVFEVVAGSGTITPLASFNGNGSSLSPNGLIVDNHGNLFGTTSFGGSSTSGSVFEVVAGSATITTLASFNYGNGAYPYDSLAVDNSGNLFGTANLGGVVGKGTVFELAAGSATITTVDSFNGTNGAYSSAPLIDDSAGNFFGTTTGDNLNNQGTIFEVTPPPSFTIDTVGPTVAVTAPVNGAILKNNKPTLSATAADNVGGAGLAGVQLQYSSDGGVTWLNAGAQQTSGPFSFTFTTPLPDGVYQARAMATDKAGNTTTSAVVSFTVFALDHFVLMPGSATATAGVGFAVLVIAQDAANQPVNYGGTVTLTSNDPLVPAEGTITLVSGYGAAVVTLDTATGAGWTISASGASVTGTSGSISVTSAPAVYFNVAVPTTAITGVAVNVTVTALDQFSNTANSYTGTVRFSSTDPAALLGNSYTFTAGAGKDNGVHSFNMTLNTAGNQTITAADPVALNHVTIAGTSAAITTRGLVVKAGGFTPTATGFTVAFSKPVATGKVTLYGPGAAVQDVSLVGAHNGPIGGSIVFDSTNSIMTFNATANTLEFFNGAGTPTQVLPDDTYTVTIVSGAGANGFQDTAVPPAALDGLNNAGSANFTTTFITNDVAGAIKVLGIPDFARGPDSTATIKVPNDGSVHGIPITLYNATGVTSAAFTLSYNPTLLIVTGASALDAPAGTTFSLVGTPTIGDATHTSANFIFSNSTPQTGAAVILGSILANDPSTVNGVTGLTDNIGSRKNYGVKELLTLSAVNVNGSAFTGKTAAGIHVNAYFGDVSGDGRIDAVDVAKMAPVSAAAPGVDTGFVAYQQLDPAIVGDVANDISIDAGDLSTLKGYLLHLPAPLMSAPPGLTGIVAPNAADPVLSLAGGGPGEFPVQVMLDHPHPEGSTGLSEAVLALTYDPSVLSVSASDITLGTLPDKDWTLMTEVDARTGQIGILLYSMTPIIATQAGSLVNIAFHVRPDAQPAATAVRLVDSVTPGGQQYATSLADDQSGLFLSPGMDRVVIVTSASTVPPAPPLPRLRYSEAPVACVTSLRGDLLLPRNDVISPGIGALEYPSPGHDLLLDTLTVEEMTGTSLLSGYEIIDALALPSKAAIDRLAVLDEVFTQWAGDDFWDLGEY